MTFEEIIGQLKNHANPKNVAGMARFGIQGGIMLGVNVPVLRKMAKEIIHKLMYGYFLPGRISKIMRKSGIKYFTGMIKYTRKAVKKGVGIKYALMYYHIYGDECYDI